jgi:nucleotide-binding universal stress UspA family protein
VIGPDEYHEPVDDNAYTNVMARWNLRRAAGLGPDAGLSDEERERWLVLAEALVDGYEPESGVYEQFAGFSELEPLVIADLAPRRPVAAELLLGRERVEGAQVVKQADVLMLHHLVPEEVEPGSLTANLRFYEPRTAHGSSLSPGIHAALFARAGMLDEALAGLRLASRIDLDDLTETTAGGLHLAAMGSVWQALAFGFAGLRPTGARSPRPLSRQQGSRSDRAASSRGIGRPRRRASPGARTGHRFGSTLRPPPGAPQRALGGAVMRLLAAVDNSAVARHVLEAANVIAPLLGASVDAIHIREDGARTARAAASAAGLELREAPDHIFERLTEAAREEDVVGLVIGTRSGRLARRLLGHVALDLLVAVSKPLVLVPPHTAMAFQLRRVLVPLDGTTITAAALTETVALARDAEVEVDVLHVREEDSLPLFSEQPQHETESWAREFIARYCPAVDLGRLHLRVGRPGEHVVGVAEETGADLIALGWAQDLSPGRASVVREALERSRIPVLLVPVVELHSRDRSQKYRSRAILG